MSWLSAADQQVVDVAKMVAEQGMTIPQACAAAKVSWSSQTFIRNVLRVLGRLPANSSLAPILEQSIAMEAGAGSAAVGSAGAGASATGTASASGGLLGFITAHPLLFVALLAAAGVATYYGSQAVGEWSADKPSAVSGPGPAEPPGGPPPAPVMGGGFVPLVVHINGAPRIVSVRTVDAVVAGIPQCNFRHGGINCEKRADVRVLETNLQNPYRTASDATAALCRRLQGPLRKPALAAGFIANFDGKTVTVDDYGGSSLDFKTCRSVIR